MMAELWLKKQNKKILSQLEIASSFSSRGIGLLKYNQLSSDQGLWIKSCCSIHTFFMRFSIDCIFVDKNLIIRSLVQDVKPWRLVTPQWGASSVIEVSVGSIKKNNLVKGDQLYVVS